MKNFWSTEEDKILKNNYKTREKDFILNLLPKRNWVAIQIRAKRLGVTRLNYYTKNDINFIKKNYVKMKSAKLSEYLGRSIRAIEKKARELGLNKQEKWNSKDVEFIRKNISKMTAGEISKELKRTRGSVYHKIQELSLQKKTKRYNTMSDSKILRLLHSVFIELGRTPTRGELLLYNIPSEGVLVSRFGSYGKACILAGIPINQGMVSTKILVDKNNNKCFSNSEKRISDFFIENNIEFSKEVLYSKLSNDKSFGKMRVDWLLKDRTLVEYFGMSRNKKYKKSMNKKIRLCETNDLRLISIIDREIGKLKEIFFDYI